MQNNLVRAATAEAPSLSCMAVSFWQAIFERLLRLVEIGGAFLLVANLGVVLASVVYRYVLHSPFEWADDVARALLVAQAFVGASAALARDQAIGVQFFCQRLPTAWLRPIQAFTALATIIVSASLTYHALELSATSHGQTTASGLPQNLFVYPMAGGGACMTVFAVNLLRRYSRREVVCAMSGLAAGILVWLALSVVAPQNAPEPLVIMLLGFILCFASGLPIAYALGFAALAFFWSDGNFPLAIFSQQAAGGIDNFVLLAVPFFMLTGYVMDATGMSVRLIALLQQLMGGIRGGLNIVMVLSMVVFSGISGSKLADVAAVGGVLVPAVRRSKKDPNDAVALLTASAVMAETIPPCVNLIILGFVANISIGGLFVAGLLPAALMALALILFIVISAPSEKPAPVEETRPSSYSIKLWGGAGVALGMIVIIFGGYRSGFATATEISAFAVLYAVVIGGIAFRELNVRSFIEVFVTGSTRSGMILFIIAMAQTVAYVLTIKQIPHGLADLMISLSSSYGAWSFMLISVVLLIVMGSVLEGAAALIIFGPLLVPVATQLGIDPLHYGIVLIIGMGIGLFAPPLGLGLYASCAVGGVEIEKVMAPTLKYLGVIFVCLLLIAFVPEITLVLAHHAGY